MNLLELRILGVALGWCVAGVAGLPLPAVIGALTVLAVSVGLAAARPGVGAFGPTRTRVRPEGIALSFDDGPHPDTTPRILAALAAADAHATFFFLADRAAAHPELVAATRAAGHEIGLHGLTHSWRLTVLGRRAGEAWVRAGLAGLAAAGAGPITRFRPPFGVVSPRLTASVRAAGLELCWCSVRTGDGVSLDPATLRARLAGVRPGDIVLLHDGNPVTVEVLPGVLAGWAGTRLGSVAELA